MSTWGTFGVNSILFYRNSFGFQILYSFQVTIRKTPKRFLIEKQHSVVWSWQSQCLYCFFYFVKCNRSIQYQSWMYSFFSQSENTGLPKKNEETSSFFLSVGIIECLFNNHFLLWNQVEQECLSLTWPRKICLMSKSIDFCNCHSLMYFDALWLYINIQYHYVKSAVNIKNL